MDVTFDMHVWRSINIENWLWHPIIIDKNNKTQQKEIDEKYHKTRNKQIINALFI